MDPSHFSVLLNIFFSEFWVALKCLFFYYNCWLVPFYAIATDFTMPFSNCLLSELKRLMPPHMMCKNWHLLFWTTNHIEGLCNQYKGIFSYNGNNSLFVKLGNNLICAIFSNSWRIDCVSIAIAKSVLFNLGQKFRNLIFPSRSCEKFKLEPSGQVVIWGTCRVRHKETILFQHWKKNWSHFDLKS